QSNSHPRRMSGTKCNQKAGSPRGRNYRGERKSNSLSCTLERSAFTVELRMRPRLAPASGRTGLRGAVRRGRALFNSVPPCGTSPTKQPGLWEGLARQDALPVESILVTLMRQSNKPPAANERNKKAIKMPVLLREFCLKPKSTIRREKTQSSTSTNPPDRKSVV